MQFKSADHICSFLAECYRKCEKGGSLSATDRSAVEKIGIMQGIPYDVGMYMKCRDLAQKMVGKKKDVAPFIEPGQIDHATMIQRAKDPSTWGTSADRPILEFYAKALGVTIPAPQAIPGPFELPKRKWTEPEPVSFPEMPNHIAEPPPLSSSHFSFLLRKYQDAMVLRSKCNEGRKYLFALMEESGFDKDSMRSVRQYTEDIDLLIGEMATEEVVMDSDAHLLHFMILDGKQKALESVIFHESTRIFGESEVNKFNVRQPDDTSDKVVKATVHAFVRRLNSDFNLGISEEALDAAEKGVQMRRIEQPTREEERLAREEEKRNKAYRSRAFESMRKAGNKSEQDKKRTESMLGYFFDFVGNFSWKDHGIYLVGTAVAVVGLVGRGMPYTYNAITDLKSTYDVSEQMARVSAAEFKQAYVKAGQDYAVSHGLKEEMAYTMREFMTFVEDGNAKADKAEKENRQIAEELKQANENLSKSLETLQKFKTSEGEMIESVKKINSHLGTIGNLASRLASSYDESTQLYLLQDALYGGRDYRLMKEQLKTFLGVQIPEEELDTALLGYIDETLHGLLLKRGPSPIDSQRAKQLAAETAEEFAAGVDLYQGPKRATEQEMLQNAIDSVEEEGVDLETEEEQEALANKMQQYDVQNAFDFLGFVDKLKERVRSTSGTDIATSSDPYLWTQVQRESAFVFKARIAQFRQNAAVFAAMKGDPGMREMATVWRNMLASTKNFIELSIQTPSANHEHWNQLTQKLRREHMERSETIAKHTWETKLKQNVTEIAKTVGKGAFTPDIVDLAFSQMGSFNLNLQNFVVGSQHRKNSHFSFTAYIMDQLPFQGRGAGAALVNTAFNLETIRALETVIHSMRVTHRQMAEFYRSATGGVAETFFAGTKAGIVANVNGGMGFYYLNLMSILSTLTVLSLDFFARRGAQKGAILARDITNRLFGPHSFDDFITMFKDNWPRGFHMGRTFTDSLHLILTGATFTARGLAGISSGLLKVAGTIFALSHCAAALSTFMQPDWSVAPDALPFVVGAVTPWPLAYIAYRVVRLILRPGGLFKEFELVYALGWGPSIDLIIHETKISVGRMWEGVAETWKLSEREIGPREFRDLVGERIKWSMIGLLGIGLGRLLLNGFITVPSIPHTLLQETESVVDTLQKEAVSLVVRNSGPYQETLQTAQTVASTLRNMRPITTMRPEEFQSAIQLATSRYGEDHLRAFYRLWQQNGL